MADYYFITSKLNGNVLDIEGASTAARTPIISYPRKTSGTDNQLWELVPTGTPLPDGSFNHYFIKSKLNGNVLDIEGANTAPRTRIISYPQKTSGTNNQVWLLNSGAQSGYFFITSELNGNVLDIEGASTAPRTQIISYPRKTSGTNNQEWMLVPENGPSPKKQAFA